MFYESAVEFLYGLQKHGIKLGLDNMRLLTSRLGEPQRRYRILHIGGTNGKGSTAALAAAILQAAGYRVGLYTSPHLIDFRERIRVNGELIGAAQVAELTERLRSVVQGDCSPTFFEFTTAMAMQHFADAAVDVAVLEVGMGGRYDATNIVEPLVTGITTVALDHEEYLGRTVDAIASEKAGIIKPGVPVIVGLVPAEAFTVIEAVASQRQAPVLRLNRDFRVEGKSPARFRYEGVTVRHDELSCTLEGRHQLDNAACALAMIEAAGASGLPVSEAAIRAGLRSVRWEGRLEVVEQEPTVLLDGAHNPSAAQVLADYLDRYRRDHPGSRVILVLGMMRDKDHRGFLARLLPVVDEVVLTQADIARAARADDLRRALADLIPSAHAVPPAADALALAKRLAAPSDLICVTGSLMLVGDIKALLRGCWPSPLRG
ncbi:MAG TPA: folylpolyglutamate synthase/dihydrofolate synthase family protein [Nitrospiraceae bacterium]|jgi:dihydrofolate synthase/folylpolyglutamate synthase|nr:folylpolyglutamate synthase/dihydrofolate synthase family protein [Nitrospiraceae bacterium]